MKLYQESAAAPASIENSPNMEIQDQEPSTMDFAMDTLQIEEGHVNYGPTGPTGPTVSAGLSGPSGPPGPDATQTQKGNVGSIIVNNSPTSDELDEDVELIKLYQNRIKQLHKAQLMSDDLEILTKNNKLIAQLNLAINELKPKTKKQPEMEKPASTKNNFKKIDIPNFQLIDDPVSTKSDHYPSYENAEAFVNTFETILLSNDVDPSTTWKKYLPNAFMLNKNEKHRRWYTNYINPISQHASWDEAKEKLIDRFGNSANKANNLEKYLDLRQLKNENIRDYVDRYLDTYRRLPYENSGSNSLDAMKFLKSLLPRAREEVTNSLKKNQKADMESYLPDNLEALFKYLEKNIGDIQEALYISVIVPNNNKTTINNSETTTAKPHSNIEGFDNNKKRSFQNNNNNHPDQQKRFKENKKGSCNYCNKANFSFDHLKTCVQYLTSDKYKQYLVRSNEMKENGRNNK